MDGIGVQYDASVKNYTQVTGPVASWRTRSAAHKVFKILFDKTVSLMALPMIGLVAIALIPANAAFNRGPLFYRQERMGLGGRKFVLLKFRTMSPTTAHLRDHWQALEDHRITPLGRVLRRSRIDELPNFVNVLLGDMSIVGPRPDAWSHALVYSRHVPHYNERFRVLPGITGLAQVRLGYADNDDLVRRKARLDRIYVNKACLWMELRIIARTVPVMVTGLGAK